MFCINQNFDHLQKILLEVTLASSLPRNKMSLSLLKEDNSTVGIVSLDLIDWDKFRMFNSRESFLRHFNHTADSIKQLPRSRLAELQVEYYNHMLKKDGEELFFDSPSYSPRGNRDKIITFESRKRSAYNSLQVDRIMKASRPSEALLNGVFFKKDSLNSLY